MAVELDQALAAYGDGMNRLVAGAIGFALWTGLVFWAGSTFTGRGANLTASKKETAQATAVVDQVNQTRAVEHSQAESMATIGAKHEEDRAAAPAVADAVVANLRSGALRLRNDLATCHTDRLSHAAASASQRDAAPDLGVTLAGPAVRIGRDADDQLRACQAVVAADRGTAAAVPAGSWSAPVKPHGSLISTSYPHKAERTGPLAKSVATGGDSDPGN